MRDVVHALDDMISWFGCHLMTASLNKKGQYLRLALNHSATICRGTDLSGLQPPCHCLV